MTHLKKTQMEESSNGSLPQKESVGTLKQITSTINDGLRWNKTLNERQQPIAGMANNPKQSQT